MVEEVEFVISPRLRGHVTHWDLMGSSGTLTFQTRYSEIGEGGCIFRIASEDYRFECGFTRNEIYLERNTYRLDYPLQPESNPSGRVQFFVIWSESILKIVVLDDEWGKKIAELSEDESEAKIDERSRVLETPATIPPNSLLLWARKQAILPSITFDTERDFFEVIVSSFEHIDDQIQSMDQISPFWNITYEKAKIKSREPKRETDIHPTIHALLYNIALAKNFEVVREPLVAGGQLDFLFSGPLKSGGLGHVCVEFKPAHSNDLLKGLSKQLPAYMRAKGCDFGVYAVLYFKGEYFPEPTNFENIHALEIFLSEELIRGGMSNIRIVVIDVSFRKSPSQL